VQIRVAGAFAAAVILTAAIALAIALPSRASAGFPPARTATPTASPTPKTPPPTPTPAPRLAPAQGPGLMLAECAGASADSARAIFLWTPSRSGAQWLDLSVFNNGFAPGTFVSAGAFDATRWGFVWSGLHAGETHFARVNTLTPAGWMTSPTLAFYTPACDGRADGPPPAPDMLALRDSLDAAVHYWDIDAAMAITDLQTGETVDVNGASSRLPGCTINLFAIVRVVADLQDGKYPESAVGDTIAQTINRSDPILARRMMKDGIGDGDVTLGMTRVNAWMQALGMTSTLMDHPPAYPEESLSGDPDTDNRITPLDVNRGLRALWDGRALLPPWRDYLLRKMTLVKPGLNYLIPVGTSDGAIVSHKNGFLWAEGWSDNDIGIVWYERGGQRVGYAISYYSQHFTGKYDGIPLGQRVSALAYQWFVARYGYP